MATPVFCCGFECGVDGTTGQHWSFAGGNASFNTGTVRSGGKSLRINPTAAVSGAEHLQFVDGRTVVTRFYVRFATLPSATCFIYGHSAPGGQPGVYFNSSDSKIYAGSGTANLGATGISVITGIWYRIDFKALTTANPWVVDVSVDGVACGQHTRAVAAGDMGQLLFGNAATAATADMYFDDFILSYTSGDFPIGPGKVEHFVPTADGTHNIAGTGDFQRGNTAVDILNATTTAFQLVDDVPLPSGTVDQADCWRGVAPANPTTDYVEGLFGPATGISAPTIAPRAVEVILAHHQIATTVGQMQVRLNDNGTVDTIFDTGAAAGVTTYRYARKHYAAGPAGTWVIGGGGNGDFTDLRCRFLAQDANPDQCLDAIMIEAEFLAQSAFTLVVDPATYTFTTQSAGLLAQRKLVVTNAVYAFTSADVTLRKGYKLVLQEAVYAFTTADATFSVTRKLIVTHASYSFTPQTANLIAQRKLVVTEAVYSFTPAEATFRVARKMTVDPAVYNYTDQNVSFIRGLKFAVDPANYSFTTADAGLKAQRKLPATEAVYLFTAQDAGLIYDQPGSGNFNFPVDPAVYNFTTADANFIISRKLLVDPAIYLFTTADANLSARFKQYILRRSKIANDGNKISQIRNAARKSEIVSPIINSRIIDGL